MNTFIDTSAFLSVLNASDEFHALAKMHWADLLTHDTRMFTSNYVIIETVALIQHRFGMEAVRVFNNEVLPIIEIIWIDQEIHMLSNASLLTANRRQLSLVDCSSFEIMRQNSIDVAFSFDDHFNQQGFTVLPARIQP